MRIFSVKQLLQNFLESLFMYRPDQGWIVTRPCRITRPKRWAKFRQERDSYFFETGLMHRRGPLVQSLSARSILGDESWTKSPDGVCEKLPSWHPRVKIEIWKKLPNLRDGISSLGLIGSWRYSRHYWQNLSIVTSRYCESAFQSG